MAKRRRLKKKVKKALIAILVLSVLILGGLLAFQLIKNKNHDETKNNPLSTDEAKKLLETEYVHDETEYVMKDYITDLGDEYYVFHYYEEVFFVHPNGDVYIYLSEDGTYQKLNEDQGNKTSTGSNVVSTGGQVQFSDIPSGEPMVVDNDTAEVFADTFFNALYYDYYECEKYVDYVYGNPPAFLDEEIMDYDDDHTDNTLSNMLYLNRFYGQYDRISRVRSDVDEIYFSNQGKSSYHTDKAGSEFCVIEYERTTHVVSDDAYVAEAYNDGDTHVFKLLVRKTEEGWRVTYLDVERR